MRVRPVAAAFLSLAFFSVPASHSAESPYKGQERRPIKALSEQEVEDLLAGNGMGFAKAAELNRYPGPLHVLESASRLDLTEAQQAGAQQLREDMKREAVPLGRQIIERERELDARFAAQGIDEGALAASLAEIGRLTGALGRPLRRPGDRRGRPRRLPGRDRKAHGRPSLRPPQGAPQDAGDPDPPSDRPV